MMDYQTMIAQCGSSQSSAACVAAMNQFLSDVYLIVPDTRSYITNLKDKVSSNKDQSTYKKNTLATLQTTVNTWIDNMVKVTNNMNAADSTYFSTLSSTLQDISALQDQQSSPVFAAAHTQSKLMQDRLTQLRAAAGQYLSIQRDNVRKTANYIYELFKNDQAIIANTASSTLTTETAKAQALQANIDVLRRNFQGNVTAQAALLDGLRVRVTAAKASADKAAADTRAQIMSQIQSGLANSMAAAQAAFETQAALVRAAIDAKRTASYASFDSIFSAGSSTNDAVDTIIATNISGAQASLDQLSQMSELNMNGARTAGSGAMETLTGNQAKFQQSINSGVQAMNETISEYVEKAATVSKNIYGQSQAFMQSFMNLASDAAGQTSGSMKAGAKDDANALSGLNSVVGSLGGGAASQSATSANGMADQISSARDSAAMTSVKQVAALADAINTMNALVALLKSKLGFSGDKSSVQAGSVTQLLNQSRRSLERTLSKITRSITNQVNKIIKSTSKRLNGMKGLSNEGKRKLENRLGGIGRSLSGRINQVTIKRNKAVTYANQIAYDGAQMAKKMAAANDGVAGKVTALTTDVNTKWGVVNKTNDEFFLAVATALNGLQKQAFGMADQQLATALGYIGNKSQTFQRLVNQSNSVALTSQNSAAALAQTVVNEMRNSSNLTQADAYKLAQDTILAANSTINSAKLVPPVLIQMSGIAHNKLLGLSTNASALMSARVDITKAELMNTIRNWTLKYRNDTAFQLDPLNASMVALNSALETQLRVRDILFPTGVNPFSLSRDQFKTLLNSASSNVTNASNSLDGTYATLGSSLVGVYNALVASINDVNSQVSMLVPNVSAAAAASAAVMQQQVNSNLSSFQSYGSTLVQNFITNRSNEETATQSMVNANKQSFDTLILNGNVRTQKIMQDIRNVSQAEQARQAALADAMDDVVKSLIAMSGNDAMALQNIKAQFQALQASSSGLSEKLNASLANAINSVNVAANKASLEMQNQLARQNREALTSIGSLGDRLSLATATLRKGSAKDLASLSSADADAVALAKVVEGMGDKAKASIKEMLQKVLAGQMSMADVLKSRTNVNVAQLGTVSDVINAFIGTMQKFISNVTAAYDLEDAKLSDFSKAIPVVVNNYEQARSVAMSNARAVVRQANATAQSYAALVSATQTDAGKAVSDARDRLSELVANFPETVAELKAEIKAAAEAVEDSQDKLASGIAASARSSYGNIVSKIRAFRGMKQKESYALSTERVTLPTAAPRIALST
jgi:hypothetical protein